MKGPGGRWRHDVARVWECPACRRREKTSGAVVNHLCEACGKNAPPRLTWMRLVEEAPRRPA